MTPAFQELNIEETAQRWLEVHRATGDTDTPFFFVVSGLLSELDRKNKELAAAVEHASDLVRQRNEARQWAEETVREMAVNGRVVTCVYCGQEYGEGTPTSQDERLTAHIEQCEKHPMTKLKERDEQWRKKWEAALDTMASLQQKAIEDLGKAREQGEEQGYKSGVASAIDAIHDTGHMTMSKLRSIERALLSPCPSINANRDERVS